MALKHFYNKENNPQRVVILGKGFVGKRLYDKLIEKKINVKIISRNELDLIQEDASKRLSNLLKANDTVLFTSAITPSKEKGKDAFVKNIQMAKNVCDAVEKIDIAHMIYMSSDSVYSFQDEVISENTLPSPSDLYGIMHLSREYMLKEALKCPLAILRSTLVYGLEDPHNSYGPNRLRRMLVKENKIKLFGNGEEKRDHIYIDDLTSFILLVILYQSYGTSNIATGDSISYYDVAKKLKTLYEKESNIEFTTRQNKILHRYFDISSIKESFPFFSFIPIEEGLKKVYQEEIKKQ